VFSTDLDFEKNSFVYANEDLVLLDIAGGQLSLFFDGSEYGVKSSANLDAAAISSTGLSGSVYLSFDITVTLPTVGVVADEDIVVFENGQITGVINGSDLGIPEAADIDALYLSGNTLYFSLDITADIDGNIGSDQNVWAFDIGVLNVRPVCDSGLDRRADLTSLDRPVDSDDDWLTDFEEYSGVDEVSSTVPNSSIPLSPHGYVTLPLVSDTDGDDVSDGLEAIYGTDPTNPNDFPNILGSVIIVR
jgi:hypothetical protein